MMFSSLRIAAAARSTRRLPLKQRYYNLSTSSLSALFNPSEEHAALRATLRTFVQREVHHTMTLWSDLGERGISSVD